MKPFEKPIQVTKAFLPPMEEFVESISRIWESSWLTNQGPIHEQLRSQLKQYLKASNITLFVNGHMALDVALKGLQLNGEIITTPFTFASTTHAISMNGLTPVFCDIKEDDYTIDEDKIEALISDKTSAIIPVHVYGNPCNVERLQEIAAKHNLMLIYDAAHVFGVEYNGKPVSNYGDISMFSFHATKVFNTIEGGALVYNNPEFERQFDLYKNFGITGPETVEAVGLNAKMNEFAAAMGLCNLKYVDKEIEKRRIAVNIYRRYLKDIHGIKYLDDKPGVKHNYAYFPIIIEPDEFGLTRDEVCEKLKQYNVFTRKYFYPLVTDFDCYKNDYNSNDTPIAKHVSQNVLTLPIYGSLSEDEIIRICEIISMIRK
ncbi:MAG TPA: DegT/DnrJ/EryC1/StrS family aminotransferase [Clostridia bacterium]|nr:DegT/DnrJ/EryC1/StrS family aminotransferase [Clostridia bacterium]